MRIDNPNADKPYQEVRKDSQGNETYGIRRDEDGNQEWVHLPTGKSTHSYYKPEVVLDPTGCDHLFEITDVGKREIECKLCHYATTFHVTLNYYEDDTGAYIKIKDTKYPIS